MDKRDTHISRNADSSQTFVPAGLERYFKIRYVKLHFSLEILEDGILPRQKASALRGGMGRMLLMSNCIRDENCGICDFEEDCLVRRMMYPRMMVRPQFMTGRDSEGYVLECENTEEGFQKGDILGFNLLLFGRTIVYFTQFLQAFHYLGMQGLGKNHVPFRVKQVTNSKGEILVDGNNVFKENYKVMCLEEYVRYRLSRLPKDKHYTLIFHSPLTIKYRGEVQNSFSPEAVLAAVERRLYILNCFEGREEGVDYERINVMDHVPTLTNQKVYSENIRRFSGTQKAKMSFYGIRGYCSLTGMDDLTKAILAAGELVHIGKNTSFGFGRYTLTET